MDAMSLAIESQPSIVRKHMGFWASQGILKEHPLDTFTVVERQEESKQAQGMLLQSVHKVKNRTCIFTHACMIPFVYPFTTAWFVEPG